MSPGERGSILRDVGTLMEGRLTGKLSPISLRSLLEKGPLLVLRADPMLRSMGAMSSCKEVLLAGCSMGNIFLGYYSLKDFLLVC